MKTSGICGIDFGTSNSTIGIVGPNGPELVPLEGRDGKAILETPSAVFFSDETPNPLFGQSAVSAFAEGEEGRLMRALKSILGSSLINETTIIKRNRIAFKQIIGMFIANMVERAKGHFAERDLQAVTIGRPVFFVDDDPKADATAQQTLADLVKGMGFKDVAFQYEPIAAALDFEQSLEQEQLALIVDIGGGTSDFSIVRVSPERAKKPDRKQDVLANDGMHIGGTDFDRLLSLDAIMPHFGLGSQVRDIFNTQTLEMPSALFHDLARWHRIHMLYGANTMETVAKLKARALSPELLERLERVLDDRMGHQLAFAAEAGKIDLSKGQETLIDLSRSGVNLKCPYVRSVFEAKIARDVLALETKLQETLKQAGLGANQINTVFMTGGSTAIPAIKALVQRNLREAKLVKGDRFASVGLGLTLDASRRWA